MTLDELRTKPHLSASSINDYVDCGLLYRFGRVERLVPEFKSDSLEFGSVIHKVLADSYQEKMLGNKMLLKELQELFENYWRESAEGRQDIRYQEGKDFDSLLMEGKELLTSYYTKLPEDDFRILGIEEAFCLYLSDVPVPIIGATDLMEEDSSGTLIITDFKTSGRAYSTDEVDQNFQLTLYQMGARRNGYREREILLRLDCLIKTKSPKFEQYWTTRNETDEKRAVKKIMEVWNGISKGVFVPNDTGWKCKGCAYKEHCDRWLEGGDS